MIPTASVGHFGIGHTQASASPDVDPHFANVVLLIDASGRSNNSTPSDLDVIGKTPTYNGGAKCKTDNSIFGGSSLYCDGAGDYVSFADSADWAMGTGDFTCEAWVCPEISTREIYFLSQATALGGFYPFLLGRKDASAAPLNCFFPRISDGSTVTTGVLGPSWVVGGAAGWRHCGICRVGNNLYTFFDGRVFGSISVAGITLQNNTGSLIVGAYGPDSGSTFPWQGWIDQLRITKGVGRYTEDYAVPGAKFAHS